MKLEGIEPDRVATAVSKAVVEAVAAGGDTDAVVARAVAEARRALGLASGSPVHTTGAANTPADAGAGDRTATVKGRDVVTETDVLDAAGAGRAELHVASGALVTPLARDTAKDRGVRLVET